MVQTLHAKVYTELCCSPHTEKNVKEFFVIEERKKKKKEKKKKERKKRP